MNTIAKRREPEAVRRDCLFEEQGIIAEIVHHRAGGFDANALALQLPEPRRSLGGKEGFKTLTCACNCYLPPAVQEAFGNRQSAWKAYFREVSAICFGTEVASSSRAVLSTGVNMEYIAWKRETRHGQTVIAVVTAGVKTNALRIGVDRACAIEQDGHTMPIGTINIILLTNARLPPAALAASLVTATEAKVIALQDLDVRSVYTPSIQASGTGTDQVLVISGKGPRCNYVGGHTLLGEIMARAVTAAVTSSIRKTHNQ